MNATQFPPASTSMDPYQLAEWATDVPGTPADAIGVLIDDVLTRYAGTLDDAAVAALEAVREFHAPRMAEVIADLEAALAATRKDARAD